MRIIFIFLTKCLAMILLSILTILNSIMQMFRHIFKFIMPASITLIVLYLVFQYNAFNGNVIISICCVIGGYITSLLFCDVFINLNKNIIKKLSNYVRYKKYRPEVNYTRLLRIIEEL